MKQFVCILLSIVLAMPFHARTYCLFAGVSNYEGEGHDLRLSTDDAKQLTKLYRSHGAKVQLLTGKNATSTNIIKYLRMLGDICTNEDQVVFFFSGHGIRNHLMTYDETEKLSYDSLYSELRKIDCSNIIIYADACFSGSMFSVRTLDGEEYINANLEANKGDNDKFIIISSSRNEESSHENRLMAAGYFTNALLSGLKGAADINNDKQVTTIELFKYVYADVTTKLKALKMNQHPTLSTNVQRNKDVVLMKLD